jgi:hypothetical protein
MKSVEKCKSLRALFAKQERWVKGYWNAWRDGKYVYPVKPSDVNAVNCFCLDGALNQVYGKGSLAKEKAEKRLVKAILKLGFRKRLKGPWESQLISFNDSRLTKWEHIKAVIHAARV